MFASTSAGLQNAVVTINNLASQLNVAIPGLNTNDQTIVGAIGSTGTSLADQINANIVNPANSAFDSIDANIVNEANAAFNTIDSAITNEGNALINYINGTVLGSYIITGDSTGTINNRLNYEQSPLGLLADIAQTGISFGATAYRCSAVGYRCSAVGGAGAGVTPVPWTAVPQVLPSNQQWIPIGSSTPVNVTPAEQNAIMSGIAARTTQLNGIKNQKISEVNALTSIAAVIAYDVTSEWPDIPMPPGYVLEPPVMPPSGGVTLSGAPIVTTGVPEAPSDSVTYGRYNMTWVPALAKSGDVLDGGSF